MQIENKDNEIAQYEKEISLTKKEKEVLLGTPYVFPGKDALVAVSKPRPPVEEVVQKPEKAEESPWLVELQALVKPIQVNNQRTITASHSRFKALEGDVDFSLGSCIKVGL
jgi:hypothetical protein